MTGFEKKVIENMTIHECENSHIIIAKREIYVPEKKIILLDEVKEEPNLVKMFKTKGGLIL